ncbi:hypothetical protein CBR_g48623 [Chara braunii]|uniref:Glycosyl transferase 64 domain-containing protein n=1 Tax=Chara braunii TaxID=69332 RepID=A0A388M368_CHABU|nr:hypothetical protein CBR_g48623 [Chara braunii]|eukprot:GBG89014.1 hypothetical protein CBR_g48623 [Chara braunii]
MTVATHVSPVDISASPGLKSTTPQTPQTPQQLQRGNDDVKAKEAVEAKELAEGKVAVRVNASSQNGVCDRRRYRAVSDLRDDKVTILVSSRLESRLPLLRENLLMFSRSPVVIAIFVLWFNDTAAPQDREFRTDGAPIRVIQQNSLSFNDRFLPREFITTAAVVIADDDIGLEKVESLAFALTVWREHRARIVGFFPRAHWLDTDRRVWKYMYSREFYSMMLTKFMVLSTEYLYMYTCHNAPGVREYVEKGSNCEDIAMNFLVSNLSHVAPLLLQGKTRDWGDARNSQQQHLINGAVSSKKGHQVARADCIAEFVRLWGGMPLRYNYATVVPQVEQEALCDKHSFLVNCETHAGTRLQVRRVVGEHVVVKRHTYAYATLVSSVSLIRTALVLAQSLRSTGTAHHLVLMVSSAQGDLKPIVETYQEKERRARNGTEEGEMAARAVYRPETDDDETTRMVKALFAHYDVVRVVNKIENPHGIVGFDKINAWLFTEYSKMVFLDVDMLVLDNLDELFDRPEPAAVPDLYIGNRFNSGLMVLKPSKAMYADLVAATSRLPSYNKGDQGFFNSYFDGWYDMPSEHRLHFRFNTIVNFPRHYHSPQWFDANRADEVLYVDRDFSSPSSSSSSSSSSSPSSSSGGGGGGGGGDSERRGGPIRVIHFANPWYKPWSMKMSTCGNVWCTAWRGLAGDLQQNSWAPIDPPEPVSPVRFLPHPEWYPAYDAIKAAGGHFQPPPPTLPAAAAAAAAAAASSAPTSLPPSFSPLPRPRHSPVRSRIPLWTDPKDEVLVTLVSERTVAAAAVWAASYRKHHASNYSRCIMLMVPSSLRKDLWDPLVPLFDRVQVVPPLQLQVRLGGRRRLNQLQESNLVESKGNTNKGGGEEEELSGKNIMSAGAKEVGLLPPQGNTSSQQPEQSMRKDEGGKEKIGDSGIVTLGEEFNVLHLWNLTDWAKVVYVNPMSLFVENVNSLFDYQPFAAGPAVFPPDQFSSRVLVIRPWAETYQDLLQKANQLPNIRGPDAEGFLNEYFYDWYSMSSKHRISPSYIVDMWFKEWMMEYFRPYKILTFNEDMGLMDVGVRHTPGDRQQAVQQWRDTFCGLEESVRRRLANGGGGGAEKLCATAQSKR